MQQPKSGSRCHYARHRLAPVNTLLSLFLHRFCLAMVKRYDELLYARSRQLPFSIGVRTLAGLS